MAELTFCSRASAVTVVAAGLVVAGCIHYRSRRQCLRQNRHCAKHFSLHIAGNSENAASASIVQAVPASAAKAVLVTSEELSSPVVCGYDFEKGVNYDALLDSYCISGFQATNFGLAVRETEQMLQWSLADEPVAQDEEDNYKSTGNRRNVRTTIWLSYTSNLISSGLRETFRFLVEHEMVQVLITTAGGVEEDLIKCLGTTHIGEFALPGKDLRHRGLNRIGNLLVPNDNYCLFEDWVVPIFDKMLEEQLRDDVVWTPSRMIHRLGREMNNETSVCYWAYKNSIPIFSPALTDGSIGDMLYFHSYKNPGLKLDIVSDIRAINDIAVHARKTGVIVLGGGLVKHHCLNANLMRNGADFAVYINTGQEFDGSDSGARPDEAVSWGKIRTSAHPVKVCADATFVFPLLVAKTFANIYHRAAWKPSERIYNKKMTEEEAS